MKNIYDVADYFLTKESMTHKKLQKLCYYSQAWFLANYNEPLMQNRFEAWVHGPVSPDLYQRYRGWGWESIPKIAQEKANITGTTADFLNLVYGEYGGYDADELEAITHREEPWQKARAGCPSFAYSRNPIALNDMRDYYGKRIGKTYD